MNQGQKRKARLRLARRVALVTVCLLIGVCVCSVLLPVSTADGFFSRAKVWISNVFQLDSAVEAQLTGTDDYSIETPNERAGYKNVREIHAAFGFPVYEPKQMNSAMKLEDVEVNAVDGRLVSLRYSLVPDEETAVRFLIRPMGDIEQPAPWDDATTHTAPMGKFSIFKASSDGWRAVACIGEVVVSIHGEMDLEDFLTMIDTLRAVN